MRKVLPEKKGGFGKILSVAVVFTPIVPLSPRNTPMRSGPRPPRVKGFGTQRFSLDPSVMTSPVPRTTSNPKQLSVHSPYLPQPPPPPEWWDNPPPTAALRPDPGPILPV